MIKIITESLCKALKIKKEDLIIFPSSYHQINNVHIVMVIAERKKYIVIFGAGPVFEAFKGELVGKNLKLCFLTSFNRISLNKYFKFTIPQSFGKKVSTFGAGDRLGLASQGHVRVLSKSSFKPILAQQSVRELRLTKRNYQEVLDSAIFAVFEEGYEGGFGADADHISKESDIIEALNCGYTMITLDCSEKMEKRINDLTTEEVKKKYSKISLKIRKILEKKYLNRSFDINGYIIKYTKEEFVKNVLMYYEVIKYIIYIYQKYIYTSKKDIDFEISIDETEIATSPNEHLFVAQELIDSNVNFTSLAPKFIGEFQKGIDYKGNLKDFEKQFKIHTKIADYFGYKLSIHSGSEKFSIFNIINKYTNGRFNIKTSGTSWLEAIGTIAECNPSLYRSIHKCAILHFNEACQFYHVSADLSKIDDINSVKDKDLHKYLEDENARQMLHITYGFILEQSEIKLSIYETLRKNEDTYTRRLEINIERHLELLDL